MPDLQTEEFRFKVAMTACMRELLTIMNTLVKRKIAWTNLSATRHSCSPAPGGRREKSTLSLRERVARSAG
jgi:hypothetical protein